MSDAFAPGGPGRDVPRLSIGRCLALCAGAALLLWGAGLLTFLRARAVVSVTLPARDAASGRAPQSRAVHVRSDGECQLLRSLARPPTPPGVRRRRVRAPVAHREMGVVARGPRALAGGRVGQTRARRQRPSLARGLQGGAPTHCRTLQPHLSRRRHRRPVVLRRAQRPIPWFHTPSRATAPPVCGFRSGRTGRARSCAFTRSRCGESRSRRPRDDAGTAGPFAPDLVGAGCAGPRRACRRLVAAARAARGRAVPIRGAGGRSAARSRLADLGMARGR